MRRQKEKITSPFQDYKNGVLYYGCVVGDEIYCVTSRRGIYPWTSIQEPTPIGFDTECLRQYVRRQGSSRPAVVGFLKAERTVSPRELYQRIKNHLIEHVRFKNEALASLLSLWTMGTYVYRVFPMYPYLWLVCSFRSGVKDTLLRLLQPIAFNAFLVWDLVGQILCATAQLAPTLLIDQLRTLPSGSRRASAARRRVLETGWRADGSVSRNGHTVRTYCPKIFAGLDEVPPRIAERSIPLDLMLRGDSGIKKRYQESDVPTRRERALKDDLYLFGWTYAGAIAATAQALADPVPSELWRPLWTLAHIVDPERSLSDWAGLREWAETVHRPKGRLLQAGPRREGSHSDCL